MSVVLVMFALKKTFLIAEIGLALLFVIVSRASVCEMTRKKKSNDEMNIFFAGASTYSQHLSVKPSQHTRHKKINAKQFLSPLPPH